MFGNPHFPNQQSPPLFLMRLADIASKSHSHSTRFPIAARLNGEVVGLQTTVPASGAINVEFLYSNSTPALEILRHSVAHLMARAVMRLFPDLQLGFGTSVENGFYYDFSLNRQITEADFPRIETEMRRLTERGETFERLIVPREKAERILESMNQPMKLEHLRTNLRELPTVFFYRLGEFLDLSRGPHVLNAQMLQHFKLLSVAESNWKGNAQKPLQRVYGTAFFHAEDLKNVSPFWKKRENETIEFSGNIWNYNSLDPRVGSGLALWLPKGAVIR